jgi:fructokinase
MIRIGIDLGGTKIEGIAIDRNGQELARRRIGTPRGNYAATLDAISGLVTWLEAQAGFGRATVGIGIPGVVSPKTGLVKNANSTWLIGHPLDRDVAERLDRHVRLQNDANCFAVSEAADGAGTGFHTVFGVIIGTGTGAGIVVGGKVLTGRNAIAGEWGHTSLPWPSVAEHPGPACYCGRPGCIETWVSGPGCAADHERATGQKLSAPEIADRAEAGDAAATATLERYENRLARGLTMVIDVLDPDVIVLGGGMSNVGRLYRTLPALLNRWCFSDGIDTPIVKARHGDSSGVRGAAWLWGVNDAPERGVA